ncbi:MAG: hypothetical protein LBU51_04900 [Bacteroidales bacterium]|nr:hypothetical protein [Bacteroidales bacterium]
MVNKDDNRPKGHKSKKMSNSILITGAIKTKQLIFYCVTSFVSGAILYILLERTDNFGLAPLGGDIFFTWICGSYPNDYPFYYIFIVSVFYALFAALFSNKFAKSNIAGQTGWLSLIILFTILASSPFGGILTYYLDMRRGYFPDTWVYILLTKGIFEGLFSGWIVIAFAFPYNLLCVIGGYFLTKIGSKCF